MTTTSELPEWMADPGDPMPEFVIKGKDLLALPALRAYRKACERAGIPEQAREVGKAYEEIAAWQSRHPDVVRLPDHRHVPAGRHDRP